jgi:hypothetical protein
MTKAEIIKKHSIVCSYRGAGPKKWHRSTENHKGKGSYKYRSEEQRVKQCGAKLYNWCIKNGLELAIDWKDLESDQLPDSLSRCIIGAKHVRK